MKFPEKINSKSFLVVVALFAILTAFLSNLALSAYVGSETEQWFTPSQEPTYIIGFYNSTFHYLQNHTGHGSSTYEGYDFLSTNASKLIDFSLANVSAAGGGVVFLKAGSYTCDSDISLYNNTALVGESRDSVILINARSTATGYTAGLLKNQNINESVYEATANWNKDYNLTVAHLTLWGNRTGGKAGFGIAFSHADNIVIEDVKIKNFAADSVNFNGLSKAQGGRGQGNGTSYGVRINGLVIEDAGIDGLAFNGVYNFFVTNFNCSYFSQLGSGTNNGWGFTLAGSSSYGTVDGFHFEHSTEIDTGGQGAGGIHAINTVWVTFSNGWISNCNGTGIFVESSGSLNPQYCSWTNVHVVNSTSENIFLKNGYDLSFSNGICLNSGYGTDPANNFNNVYFLNTERSGMVNWEMRDNQGTHTTYCGLYEDATSGSNEFVAIRIFGCSNATGIYLLGASTQNSTIIASP